MRDTEKIIELVQAIGPQWVTVAEQFTNKTPQVSPPVLCKALLQDLYSALTLAFRPAKLGGRF